MSTVPTWDYEPGTVAAIRCDNEHNDFHAVGEFRAVKDEKGWASLLPEIGWVSNADVVEVRPLAVLDPDDRGVAVRLLAAYAAQYADWTPSTDGPNVDRLQEALRSLTRAPRIPELTIEQAWVIYCARCATAAEADGSEGEARADFHDRGWRVDDGRQYCPDCMGGDSLSIESGTVTLEMLTCPYCLGNGCEGCAAAHG